MQERRELPSFMLVDEMERVNLLGQQDYLRAPISSDTIEHLADLAIQLAAKNDTPLSVFYADLNYLKEVNESVGHIAGNQLLSVVDRVMRDFVRSETEDYIIFDGARGVGTEEDNIFESARGVGTEEDNIFESARVGGDEWVILSASNEHGAKLIRDRLTTQIEEGINQIANEAIKRCSPGVSIGFATILPGENITGRELLKKADDNLQLVKRSKDPQLNWWKAMMANTAEFMVTKMIGMTPSQFVKYIRRKNSKQTA